MVEYNEQLDRVFTALSDSTRRAILNQISVQELSISQIALAHQLTFAAISKHIQVLEQAHLITKRRQGKQRIVSITPKGFESIYDYILKLM